MKLIKLFTFLVYFFPLFIVSTTQATRIDLLPEDRSNTPIMFSSFSTAKYNSSPNPEVIHLSYKKAKKISDFPSNCSYDFDFSDQVVEVEDIRRLTSISSQITGLNLMESYMGEEVFALLGKLTNLVDLTLADILKCNDETIIHLSTLKKLEKLNINHTKVTANGLELLIGSIPGVKVLNAGCNNLGNSGIKAISLFKSIEVLNIDACGFDDSALPYLSSMPNLKKVVISVNKISSSALQKFIQDNAALEIIAERLLS